MARCGGSRRCGEMPAIEVEADGRETQSSATVNHNRMVGDVVVVPESREAANLGGLSAQLSRNDVYVIGGRRRPRKYGISHTCRQSAGLP